MTYTKAVSLGPLLVASLFITPHFAVASPETTALILKALSGNAEFSTAYGAWQPLKLDSKLIDGSLVRTHEGSAVDFYLQESKTTLRLTANSKLAIGSLQVWRAGEQDVTDTKLKLLEGSLVGSQRKLAKPSRFKIETTKAVANIIGTEYVVRSDGAVSVLSGSISVTYNKPGNNGSIKVDVPAGQSFNPVTGTVVPTTPAYLNNIIADINTVQHNAEVFKAGGATIVVKADDSLSPTKPHGNNGVGNGVDPQPPGNPPVNDGPGTGPGNPGNKGGTKK